MATVLEAPVTPAMAAVPARRVRAVVALARAEGRRFLRHPILWAGFLLSGALFAVMTWDRAPVLHHDDILTGLSVLPMAGSAFLVANLAATRVRRHRTDELFDTTAIGPAGRTLAHVLSVGWAAGAATLLVGGEMAFLVANRPVGSPSVFELLVGPLAVWVAGAAGVAVARWLPSLVAGPVGLVGLAALQWILGSRTAAPDSLYQPARRWLGLWVPISVDGDPPRELVIRPEGWHVLYLIGLLVLTGAVALLRSGATRRRLAAGGAALAVVILTSAIQLDLPSDAERAALGLQIRHPERYQHCERQAGVRYCAYPAYAPWINRWAGAVEGIVSQLPAQARPKGLEVRQMLWPAYSADLRPEDEAILSDRPGPDGRIILVPATWGRGSEEGAFEMGIALEVAARGLGFPALIRPTPEEIDRLVEFNFSPDSGASDADRALFRAEAEAGRLNLSCSAVGQARAVVAVWLGAQSTDGTGPALREAVRLDPYGLQFYPLGGYGYTGAINYGLETLAYRRGAQPTVMWGKAEATYAVQLLDRPAAQVRETIRTNWDRLVDPATSVEEAVRLFGLRGLPTLEQQLAAHGFDPAEARGLEDPMAYEGGIRCH